MSAVGKVSWFNNNKITTFLRYITSIQSFQTKVLPRKLFIFRHTAHQEEFLVGLHCSEVSHSVGHRKESWYCPDIPRILAADSMRLQRRNVLVLDGFHLANFNRKIHNSLFSWCQIGVLGTDSSLQVTKNNTFSFSLNRTSMAIVKYCKELMLPFEVEIIQVGQIRMWCAWGTERKTTDSASY